MILTASLTYSQEYIQITPGQAKEAIKTKHRAEQLEIAIRKQSAIVVELQVMVEDLELQVKRLVSQNGLKDERYNILQTKYNSMEEVKDPSYSWGDFLIDATIGIAAFLAGAIVALSL